MLRDELVFLDLHLVSQLSALTFALFKLFLQGLGAQLRSSLLILSHARQESNRLLLITVDLLRDIVLEYFLDELSKLADGFVEEREELVGLQTQVFGQLVDCLVLESHSSEGSSLHVGEGHRAFRQDEEEELGESRHKVHDQVEVHQVLCVRLQSLQVKNRDVLL